MPCHGCALISRVIDWNDAALARLAEQVATRLTQQGQMLIAAESCTGGWIAKVCTDLPGSSAWFAHGLVTYSNAAKQRLLGVKAQTLERAGAVSCDTAEAMVTGAVAEHANCLGIAVTGIAGPSGGSVDKPVGTVCFAWLLPGGGVHSEQACFDGGREAIRRASVAYALSRLLDGLNGAMSAD